ncbi:hypothetical protein KKB18_05290, partial [bacterium]|nr:hypothetical protein [bacterium]
EVLSLLANTMVQVCYTKRNEYLYRTKSKTTLTKIFGGQDIQKPSLEEGILRDMKEDSYAKLDIYADDSFKNPERAVYTGNVNIKKGDMEIQANNVDCDLKKQILYIKGDIRLVKQKGLLLRGESIEYDVPNNKIISLDKLNIITVKDGKLVEKKGNIVLFELDTGKILIDNVEYKEE